MDVQEEGEKVDQCPKAEPASSASLGERTMKEASKSGRENALLRATLENMAQGVAMYDGDHRLVTWNSLFCEYLNMPEEFLGTDRTFSDYIRYIGARGEFGNADIEEELNKRLLRLGESHFFERVRPDGTVLEVRRDPVPGGGFVAIYTDITERKKAELQLREDQERFRAIDAAAPVGLVIVDRKTQTLKHLNPCFGEILGRDANDLLGKPIMSLFEDPEKGRELADIINFGSEERREFYFKRPDGRDCCTIVSREHLDFQGDKASVASFVDITDRVRAEADLREAKEAAESASKIKSAFLANMSHELRTPLNAIIGYSEILLEDAVDRGDESSAGDLEKIQSAGKHLLGLINDILDLSKIEAGRMDVYIEMILLDQLLTEVKTIVAPLMAKNGNTLVTDLVDNIGALRTDVTKLKQSLINLLSNAAKFTKQGTVTLRVLREADDKGREMVKLEVADSGIGMTGEQMSRLFQAFSQADSSTTRNFGGTGLGLTISKHFCTMLGGSIDVKSMPGEGSTFTIRLPLDSGMLTAVHDGPIDVRRAGAAPAPGAITVLVIDDDPAVHNVLSATLGKEGYRLLHAGDGVEALDLMRKEQPDVVTVDVMMPKMDGWSLLGAMKSDPALEHIPAIMLTIVDDRSLGYSLGASEYMTKPINRKRLVALIQKFAREAADGSVLIVDDAADVRALVRSAIEDVGMRAAEAEDGQAALDWLRRNPKPSLILLDLMMPAMDGFLFLERIRAMPEFAELPIVVLTAKDLSSGEREFLAENTLLILSKSAQPLGTLGSALAAIARKSRAPTANAKQRE